MDKESEDFWNECTNHETISDKGTIISIAIIDFKTGRTLAIRYMHDPDMSNYEHQNFWR